MYARNFCLGIVCILLIHYTNNAVADTFIITTPEYADSAAIAAIEAGIMEEDPGAKLILSSEIPAHLAEADAGSNSVIILGEEMIGKISEMSRSLQAVAGGFYGAIDARPQVPTLSLDPAISVIVREIQKTGFSLKRLATVTTSRAATDQIRSRFADAKFENIGLDVIEAVDERSTARAWFDLLKKLNPVSDAVLIMDDGFLESSGSFRHLIESSWARNILVVSVIPKYARRGVSIGFVPDLRSYGRQLYAMAEVAQKTVPLSGNDMQFVDLRVLKRVFNERTINHINIRMPGDLDRLKHTDLVLR
ncbi:hypothetical protein [Maritalea sp.]|uniref:hypothetical protein n=1 Tax=Maritalea sp. TaxID=2003361 RepID=UPI003EF5152A